MSALKSGIAGPAKNKNRDAHNQFAEADLEDETVQHGNAIFSVLAITIYLLVGAIYFVPRFGWSGWEAIYFSICTITTVGFGDYNGSGDQTTMMFTTVYAFVGEASKLVLYTSTRVRMTFCSHQGSG